MPIIEVMSLQSGWLHRFLSIVFVSILFCPLSVIGQQVTLIWDDSNDPNVGGYTLYYGEQSGEYDWSVDVGNQVSYTLSGFQIGTTYYFAVTAYSNDGTLESDYSNEVSWTVGVDLFNSGFE